MIRKIFRPGAHFMLRWWFRLLRKHPYKQTTFERIDGIPLIVLVGVMNPVLFRTGAFFARQIPELIPQESSVLDMGTGSGIVAIFAAKRAKSVMAVDINPVAVRCAKTNVNANHLEKKIAVREGDLFDAVSDEKFDVILFNPPYFAGTPKNTFEESMFSDVIILRFLSEANSHLRNNGQVYLALSDLAPLKQIQSSMTMCGFDFQIVKQKNYVNECLYVYRLTIARERVSRKKSASAMCSM